MYAISLYPLNSIFYMGRKLPAWGTVAIRNQPVLCIQLTIFQLLKIGNKIKWSTFMQLLTECDQPNIAT